MRLIGPVATPSGGSKRFRALSGHRDDDSVIGTGVTRRYVRLRIPIDARSNGVYRAYSPKASVGC